MSSDFDMSDGASDFAPAPAKAKVAKSTTKKASATSKAPASKKTTTAKPKVKAMVPKKRPNENDSDDEPAHDDESLLRDTPPKAKKAKTSSKATANPVKESHKKALGELVNEAMALDPESPKPAKKAKRVSEQYQKLTQLEHIIRRPDTYIGSVERNEKQMWVFRPEENRMEYREISFVPGVFKIFDEILVNASDNKANDKNQSYIHVTIDRERGEISVENDGRGIPIEKHSKEKIWIPEMIFGHLLTGSNYDDEEQKVTGGRNGYGAKLCNIFSTKFTVETASAKHKKKYKQTWTANMSNMADPIITDQKGEDFTRITFSPDWKKFAGMTGMDDDLEALFTRRVYDLAGTIKGVRIKLNGRGLVALPSQSFPSYCELYTKAIKAERGEEASNDDNNIVMAKEKNERWQVGVAVSEGSFQNVSFVNGISTSSGGSHVNYIVDQLVTKLTAQVKKSNKGGVQLKPAQIKNHIFLFVNSQIVNPAFTSQTKEQLTTKASSFGSKFEVTDDFIKKIVANTELMANILATQQQRADLVLKKTDGKKRNRINNPKLVDANKAGTREGHKCTLILTEGDSAKGLAMAGRAVVSPDYFGVFPLRGKILNVRDATVTQIANNAEITAIKAFMGLQHKKEYTDLTSLRYGSIMIMTDQDHDGSHIKGLLINFLQCQYPSLLKIPGFLCEFITPIVKVWKGDSKRPTKSKSFFTMPEYEDWKLKTQGETGWHSKYYKGLGTSTSEEAQAYFTALDDHFKEFAAMRDEEVKLIELAFSNKQADERKMWLASHKPGTFLDHSATKITYTDFVNKELLLFSLADCARSIPSVVDGMKPGQRKILYSAFKRNLKKDMKVVEFAGIVLGLTAYHHGDVSLQTSIVGLAQNFVGSNNVNLLEPSGNFGSRLQGGSDAASARYIYTRLSPFARKLFHVSDEPLLTWNTDDDQTIEPEIYAPIVPMVLVNGADGIGTGWSTSIPNFNPIEIVENLKRKMEGEEFLPMKPWFRGFKGEVTQSATDKWTFSGIAQQINDSEIEVSELPVRMWTQTFKDKLEDILKAEKVPSFIKDYKDYNNHKDVSFVIQMDEKCMEASLRDGLLQRFKLTKQMTTSNLVAFDCEGRIHKYENVEAILDEFYRFRLGMYARRKAHLLETMHKHLDKLSNQARFVEMIVLGQLVVSKKKKVLLVGELQKLKFKPFPKIADAAKAGEKADAVEGEDDQDDSELNAQASAYDYLLGMPLWSLTQERIDKLRNHIVDQETEIDVLNKKTIQDLWKFDLDEFVAEWEFQLEEEQKIQKNIMKNRRGSKKFTVGGKTAGRKRKNGDEDDDFEVKKKKPVAKPTAQKEQTAIANFFKREEEKAIPTVAKKYVAPKTSVLKNMSSSSNKYTDGSSDSSAPASRAQSVSASSSQTAKPPKAEPDDEKVSKPAARGRTKAPARYTIDSDDDSDGDDLLADLGGMVKGLGNADSKPLFNTSASRPSSSHDFKVPAKPIPKISDTMSDDDTDYKALAPQSSPRRSILVTNKEPSVFEVSDEEDVKPKAAAPKAKKAPVRPKKQASEEPAAKSKATKKTSAPAAASKKTTAPKKVEQSPVAKAYAKRLAKKKNVVSDDEDEDDDLVNDILDSPAQSDGESEVQPAAARPGRRAAATTARKPVKYDFGSEDDDDENDALDESTAQFDDDSD